MTFWTGVFLGFAIGGAVATVAYLGIVVSMARLSKKQQEPLVEYWRHSLAFQESQIELLQRMAEAMERP